MAAPNGFLIEAPWLVNDGHGASLMALARSVHLSVGRVRDHCARRARSQLGAVAGAGAVEVLHVWEPEQCVPSLIVAARPGLR
jgi:hypothetical protein